MKNKLRPYFSFTKKERTGIVLLVCVCLLLLFVPQFFPEKELQLTDITLTAGLALSEDIPKINPAPQGEAVNELRVALFPFNPNTIDAEGWRRLGLDDKLVQRILNYRNKGGRFYKPEDIRKIWGLPPDMATKLIPFIALPVKETKTAAAPKQVTAIDINTAEIKDWESLPGIGATLAARIIRYRNQSGGFARVDELVNVYGLTDSTFRVIKPWLQIHDSSLPKLSLNRASAYQLIQKAGLPADLAKEIVKKRQQEGNYQHWTELESLAGMTTTLLEALQKAFQLE